MTGVAALTERMVLATLRDDLPFAVLAPAGNFVVFNFGLRNMIDTGQMSYAQYLLPVIIVQVMLLGALTTVDRAARDHGSDFGIGSGHFLYPRWCRSRLGCCTASSAAPWPFSPRSPSGTCSASE